MKALSLTVKFLFYGILVLITSPLLWWLGRTGDSFEGETFAEYDDDDVGEDVDD